MALCRFFLASLLLFVLAIHLVESYHVLEHQKLTTESTQGSLVSESAAVVTALNCRGACAIRCSKSSRPNLCKRACGTCCARCKCVPQGTYGNEDSCPCYATMTTRGGAHKCP